MAIGDASTILSRYVHAGIVTAPPLGVAAMIAASVCVHPATQLPAWQVSSAPQSRAVAQVPQVPATHPWVAPQSPAVTQATAGLSAGPGESTARSVWFEQAAQYPTAASATQLRMRRVWHAGRLS